jgi:hypothetical protein
MSHNYAHSVMNVNTLKEGRVGIMAPKQGFVSADDSKPARCGSAYAEVGFITHRDSSHVTGC